MELVFFSRFVGSLILFDGLVSVSSMEESWLLFSEFEIVWMDARSFSEVMKIADSVDLLRTPWTSLVIWASGIVSSGFFFTFCCCFSERNRFVSWFTPWCADWITYASMDFWPAIFDFKTLCATATDAMRVAGMDKRF